MTSFTVRVELHDADDDDYSSLHRAMAEEGFVRWIKNGDGVKYRLPTAVRRALHQARRGRK